MAHAYYASAKVIRPLRAQDHHLLTRVRINATAYHPAPQPARRRRGRPRLYGEKVRLRDLLADPQALVAAPSPAYGEQGASLTYRCVDLLWRPIGQGVRFVLVDHPQRGRMILMRTDLGLSPLQIITLYGYRFRIECSFRRRPQVGEFDPATGGGVGGGHRRPGCGTRRRRCAGRRPTPR
ncbi:MAG: hypothetical protein AB1505_05450 [Candidatus Latescibacterota bacterium]